MKKRIVLTGGGTAGHVTPHLSLFDKLIEMGFEIHYIGTKKGIEKSIIQNYPFITYHSIQSGKLRRYFSLQNFIDPFKIFVGFLQSLVLLLKLKPQVCFSKGGFVSVPVVIACKLCGVPSLCHESDLTPGLANKICSKFATKMATTFEECAKTLGAKATYTGTAMRKELFEGDKQQGLKLTGFSGKKDILMVTGGSLGAQAINICLREALPNLLPHMDILHLCGKGNVDENYNGIEGYCQFPYLNNEMPHAYAASDFVLSRAGSNTICELLALKKPMLLIPYPLGASRGDQIQNAKNTADKGAAIVLSQDKMNVDTLTENLLLLQTNKEKYLKVLDTLNTPNGTEAILKLITQIIKK